MKLEGIEIGAHSNSPTEDHAWKGLNEVFELGIEDLYEKVDEILYKLIEHHILNLKETLKLILK